MVKSATKLTESAQLKHWCKELFWCWNNGWTTGTPRLTFLSLLVLQKFPAVVSQFLLRWMSWKGGRWGWILLHLQRAAEAPTAPLGKGKSCPICHGKGPQAGACWLCPPSQGVGRGAVERGHEKPEEVQKQGQISDVTLEKSGLGKVIKWDMGPGKREIHRGRFPYLQQKD